jgi:hypothetical protein
MCYDITRSNFNTLRYHLLLSPQNAYRESESQLFYELAVYRQSVRSGAKPLETHDHYFFQLNTCCYNPYVTSSLTRGWVCRLQLLLALASAAGLMPIFYCLRLETPPNL